MKFSLMPSCGASRLSSVLMHPGQLDPVDALDGVLGGRRPPKARGWSVPRAWSISPWSWPDQCMRMYLAHLALQSEGGVSSICSEKL